MPSSLSDPFLMKMKKKNPDIALSFAVRIRPIDAYVFWDTFAFFLMFLFKTLFFFSNKKTFSYNTYVSKLFFKSWNLCEFF